MEPGGEGLADDCGIDKFDPLPYGVGNPVGVRGRGGRRFREGELKLLFDERDS